MTEQWRVGQKLGRTLYKDEILVGMMDTVVLAEQVVAVMNTSDSRIRETLDNDWFLRTLVERLETKMGLERPFTAAHIAKGLVVQILEGNS